MLESEPYLKCSSIQSVNLYESVSSCLSVPWMALKLVVILTLNMADALQMTEVVPSVHLLQ